MVWYCFPLVWVLISTAWYCLPLVWELAPKRGRRPSGSIEGHQVIVELTRRSLAC